MKKLSVFLALLLLLSGCASHTIRYTPPPVPTADETQPTQAPSPTPEATPSPTPEPTPDPTPAPTPSPTPEAVYETVLVPDALTIAMYTYKGQEYPQFVCSGGNVRYVNQCIETAVKGYVDDTFFDENSIFTTRCSASGSMVSAVIRWQPVPTYGSDGEIWSICYDYAADTIVTADSFLDSLGLSCFDIFRGVTEALEADGSYGDFYDSIGIGGYYFDDAGKPIFIINARANPDGADPWERILFYSLDENALVNTIFTA